MIRRPAVLSAVALVALLGACSSKDDGSATALTATDSKCTPAKTSFASGKTRFKVTNKGSKVTEVYVYGSGDRIAGEVENIGPGVTRTLSADLKAGSYEIACKPGMTGRGIRVPITVTGGAAQGAAPVASREIEVHAVDYSFRFDSDPAVKAGEVIKFELKNEGTQQHEFEVIGPDGQTVGEVAPVDAGKSDDATIAFAKPGTYTYECHIADHHQRGMHGELIVS